MLEPAGKLANLSSRPKNGQINFLICFFLNRIMGLAPPSKTPFKRPECLHSSGSSRYSSVFVLKFRFQKKNPEALEGPGGWFRKVRAVCRIELHLF